MAEKPVTEKPVTDAQGRITNSTLTKADAAKLVKRRVPKVGEDGKIVLDNDGNPMSVEQAIKEAEIMNFAEYGERVVVVTTAGEKLEAAKK
jgi:hypothetical protein